MQRKALSAMLAETGCEVSESRGASLDARTTRRDLARGVYAEGQGRGNTTSGGGPFGDEVEGDSPMDEASRVGGRVIDGAREVVETRRVARAPALLVGV